MYWFFPVALLVEFSIERGFMSGTGSLLRDFDQECLLVRMGMVLVDILGLICYCCVQIVPGVKFSIKN